MEKWLINIIIAGSKCGIIGVVGNGVIQLRSRDIGLV
jgi:hypothetical protein